MKKTMTRSDAARLQPREPNGRFAGFETVMVIDEFGNAGKIPKPHETTFGYAVSVTKRPEEFGKITDKNRQRISEQKARNDSESNKNHIISGIRQTRTETYGYYVDKNHPPNGWDHKNRSKVITNVLDRAIEETLPKTDGNVYVIIDHHNAYKDRIRPMLRSKSTPDKIVDGNDFDSAGDVNSDMLQTHDYVTNAVRAHVEVNDRNRTAQLKTKIYRIDKSLGLDDDN